MLNQNRLEDAIAVLCLNVEAYPNSANVYDSLAEAYLRSGDSVRAIQFYEKTLSLNPNNTTAAEALKKLKKG